MVKGDNLATKDGKLWKAMIPHILESYGTWKIKYQELCSKDFVIDIWR